MVDDKIGAQSSQPTIQQRATTVKAAYIERTGPADNIQYGELPTPELEANQVLVKVGAVAVNPIDTYIRNGANYWELPKPYIIGAISQALSLK